MAPSQTAAETIRASVGSPSTCTPGTATILSELLLPKADLQHSVTTVVKGTAKTAAASRTKVTKVAAAKSRAKKVVVDVCEEDGEQLSPKERSILATEVINATLKALSEAIKAPAPIPLRKQASSRDLVKSSARKALRRSNSLPQTPLQPRSLNRVASSPSISNRDSRSSSSASITSSSGHRSIAECARIAFSCLRTLQASKTPSVDLPPLQLENGMSVLVGKLVTLGLDDLAIKELRILKKRLDSRNGPKNPLGARGNATALSPSLAELLDFGKAEYTGPVLGLVITTQLQILRLMTTCRKPKQIEDGLYVLLTAHTSSPTKLLLLAAKESKDHKQADKIVRQLQTLSEIMLSLCPSVSTADDIMALEPRLSVAPEVAVQLQTLALHDRFLWWGLAGHKGDISKEIMEPFLRCVTTFARRSQIGPSKTHEIASASFQNISQLMADCSDTKARAWRSVLGNIYKLLGSLAREANIVVHAIAWTEKWRRALDPKYDSDAKRCAVLARSVSLQLRLSSSNPQREEVLLELLEELERPFKGEACEIDELMTEVSSVRRSAITLLSQNKASESEDNGLSDGMRQMCESLIFLLPRLSLRYLGSLPDDRSAAKDVVRYEQRRQFINKPALHAIDSSLFLIKVLLNECRAMWDVVDSKLQDCLSLNDRLNTGKTDALVTDASCPVSYYVRISNLYYTQYLNMRRSPEGVKEGHQMRALRRSIDSVKERPTYERKAAQLSTKLERMAEFCKSTGRYDDLYQTLLALRDEIVADGVLTRVAESAASQPTKAIWSQDDGASVLGRTLHSILKVHLRYMKPTAQMQLVDDSWSAEEKAAVLEHQLEMFSTSTNDSSAIGNLPSTIIIDLLAIYDQQQYPIRRLRVLLRHLYLEPSSDGILSQAVHAELNAPAISKINCQGTKDQDLHSYLRHYKSLALTTIELEEDLPKVDVLKDGLMTWSSVRSQCQSAAAFERQIDDVPKLFEHLKAIGDYLQMKGLDTIRIQALTLVADIYELCDDSSHPDNLVLSFTSLGTQWLRLGYSGKAGLAFDRATSYCARNGVSSYANLYLHVSHCDYMLIIGSDKVEDDLSCAQARYAQENTHMQQSRSVSPLQQRTKMNLLVSDAYMMYSMLALEKGSAHTALAHAKQSLRLVRRAWANTEEQVRRKSVDSTSDVEKLAEDISHLNVSTMTLPVKAMGAQVCQGSTFWALITPLFRCLIHLSGLFAHHGLFLETVYYAEQAYKLVKEVGSEGHLAVAAACLGSTWLKAGILDQGSEYLMEAKQLYKSFDKTRNTASVALNLGHMYNVLGEPEQAMSSYDEAEAVIRSIGSHQYINGLEAPVDPSEALEQTMAQMTLTKRKTPAPRKIATKAPVKRKTTTRAKSPIEVITSIAAECPQLTSLTASIVRQKARGLVDTKKFDDALTLLQSVDVLGLSQIDTVDHGIAMATQLLCESLEQMTADPVYSVLQDSTISFPSVVGLAKAAGDRLSVVKISPPPKVRAGRGNRELAGSKSPAPDSFFDKLRQAQEYLTEAHSRALHVAPISVVHTASALLNSVAILLSAAGQVKGRSLANPGLASSSIDNARTLALRREQKVIRSDPATLKLDDLPWPQLPCCESRRSSIGTISDLGRFQRDYVDIIPKPWTVVSISISDSQKELSITKLQAGHSPFVLRLPLGRHNSMDADEEVFGFEQGRDELREIIALADESAHDAQHRTGREAKLSWWEEREALDSRMKDLLENIEKVWLGGFTGIFSQHARRPDLLARFQKSFQNILDRHLPSRRKTGRKAAGPRITLDTRILDLFIGLGDASDEDCDFSEPLTDLLYFVVDVLQFHGELNAYAEIDFDSIVIEMHDALRGYHSAVRSLGQSDEGRHTILILDKALHSIPWEGLPCMDGLAVSRLPSLGCLRDRILTQQKDAVEDAPEGHYIDRQNGAYILNPGGDLKHTQTVFQKPLQSLPHWDGIVNREPSEDEVKLDLQSKDLLLYFGHGSGAQYIRAREIKKLDKCAVTILMGCSSGALTERGEFEPHGPPINYMHAGCPALVATLWDVTDKDIDRFAKSTFEHWGLFEPVVESVTKKGRAKKKDIVIEEGKRLSLVEAVAKGRAACHLRYLNAASVCVYGVPVYFR